MYRYYADEDWDKVPALYKKMDAFYEKDFSVCFEKYQAITDCV